MKNKLSMILGSQFQISLTSDAHQSDTRNLRNYNRLTALPQQLMAESRGF